MRLIRPDRTMFPRAARGQAGGYPVGVGADLSETTTEEAPMHTTPTPTAESTITPGPRMAIHAEHAVQRVADASVWLLFRLNRVRS